MEFSLKPAKLELVDFTLYLLQILGGGELRRLALSAGMATKTAPLNQTLDSASSEENRASKYNH
jgi:hypothetical protein